MRNFASISEYVSFLETRFSATREAQKEGLRAVGEMVTHEAQDMIGEYQKAAGPFPEWAELSEATLQGGVSPEGHRYPGKVELGYAPPDNPLLRTGQMRGSIEWSASASEVVVGSHDPIAAFQEFGTHKIPPRPFIGLAMFRMAHEATDMAVKFIMSAFCGDPKPHVPPHPRSEAD